AKLLGAFPLGDADQAAASTAAGNRSAMWIRHPSEGCDAGASLHRCPDDQPRTLEIDATRGPFRYLRATRRHDPRVQRVLSPAAQELNDDDDGGPGPALSAVGRA